MRLMKIRIMVMILPIIIIIIMMMTMTGRMKRVIVVTTSIRVMKTMETKENKRQEP